MDKRVFRTKNVLCWIERCVACAVSCAMALALMPVSAYADPVPQEAHLVTMSADKALEIAHALQFQDKPDVVSEQTGSLQSSAALVKKLSLAATTPSATIDSITLSRAGVTLAWSVAGMEGKTQTSYAILRKAPHEDAYTQIAKVSISETRYTDGTVSQAGGQYNYKVKANYKDGESATSVKSAAQKAVLTIAAPASVGYKNGRATWTKAANAQSYEAQGATSCLYEHTTAVRAGSSARSVALSAAASSSGRYVRVRAYARIGQADVYSPWCYLGGGSITTAKASLIRYSEKRIKIVTTKTYKKKKLVRTKTRKRTTSVRRAVELREAARQKLYGFDVVQGSASDGTYAYFALLNKNGNNQTCKIAKFRARDLKLVKVSRPLPIDHGNGLTYDSARHMLLATHCQVHKARVSFIDADTLELVSSKDIKVPSNATALEKKNLGSITALSSVAYCAERNQYAGFIKGSHDLLILDSSLRPLKRLRPAYKITRLYQGALVTNEFIAIAQSGTTGASGNALVLYDWDGTYAGQIMLPRGYEFESAYFAGGRLHATYYCSGWGKITKVTTKTTKKAKVSKGTRTKTVRIVKYTKRRGVGKVRFIRNNRVYRVTL